MKILKRALALVCALALAALLTACGGGNLAPEQYDLSAAGVTLDSFTKVVGERQYVNRNNTTDGDKISAILVNYAGITDATADLKLYSDYLKSQGFSDYFDGQGSLQLSMALRKGDGAVMASAQSDGDKLEVKVAWLPTLDLSFGETQYVSGNSLAILPSPELVVFKYPELSEDISTAGAVNQLILDGVNRMMQYAKEQAGGQDYKLMGNYEIGSALASKLNIKLTGEFTVGDTKSTLTSIITISDVTGKPAAQYADITAQ